MTEFGKLITAMVTPFDENNTLAVNNCGQLAEKLAFTHGSDAIVLAGTTGESPTLTMDEKLTLFQSVIDRVGEHVTVIGGTGSYDTKETIELTREAEDIGVHGIMLVTPYYNKPGQRDLYNHFKSVAKTTSLPIMLYNVPKRTGVDMDEQTVLKLAEIDNIVAIKEASGDMIKIANIVNKTRGNMKVYSGDDVSLMPVLSLGGAGIVSVASHLVGDTLKNIIELYHDNNASKALKLYQSIHPLLTNLLVNSNPIPIKAAVNQHILDVGSVRPPLQDLPEQDLEQITEVYKWVTGRYKKKKP